MPTTVETDRLTVQTVAISIRALQVGKKQVTLSLFRQIPYRQILTVPRSFEHPALLGTPWGWVNYHWDYDGSMQAPGDGPPLHVLWEAEGQLYRSGIRPECPWGFAFRVTETRDQLLMALLLHGFNQLPPGTTYTVNHKVNAYLDRLDVSHQYTVTLGDRSYAFESHPDELKTFLQHMGVTMALKRLEPGHPERVYAEGLHEHVRSQMVALYTSYADALGDIAATEERYQRMPEIAKDWTHAWQSCYDTCAQAGQLFIAV